jgi:AcrR family transcriptional regulator
LYISAQRVFCIMNENYRRKKEPQENRQLILDSAMELAATKGLQRLTLDAVAKEANISKGGLLHHFPRKELLIEELFNERLRDFSEALNREKKPGISPVIAFLITAMNEELNPRRLKSMQVLSQTIAYNEYYRDLFRKWYREHVVNISDSTPAELIAMLTADGLLLSNSFGGIHNLDPQQKQQITQILTNL